MRRSMLTFAALGTITLASAGALRAQEAMLTADRLGLAAYAGASIPTGSLRDVFDNAFLLGGQATYALARHVGLLGDFDWTRPSSSLPTGTAHTNIYQADLGLEFGGARGSTDRWALRPFAEVGGGIRRFDYTSVALNDRTRGVGFAALGTDLQFGRSTVRLAARDNVFSFVAPTADATHATRNDIGLTLGLGIHL